MNRVVLDDRGMLGLSLHEGHVLQMYAAPIEQAMNITP